MKHTILIFLFSGILFCSACRSVTPVNICHTLDFSSGTRYVENRLTGERFQIDNPANASHFRLLLQENGFRKEAEQLFKNQVVLRQIYFCTRDSDNNSGWGLERDDFIESSARIIRSFQDPAERQHAAAQLLTLWQNGSETRVFRFYQQMLAKQNKTLEYYSADPDHPLPPSRIRELKQIILQDSTKKLQEEGLFRLFDEAGIMTQEVQILPDGSRSGWEFYPAFRELRQTTENPVPGENH